MSALTVVDLFAGCGGGSIGFQAAGFKAVGAVEIDGDAAKGYEMNTGTKPLVADIRDVASSDLGVTDELTLLFGCPPCQSFTDLRRGDTHRTEMDDIRDALPSQYLRLVKELLPRHIAFENVPGMVSGRGKLQLLQLVAGLRELKYSVDWAVIDAAEFGVPQHRRRLLLIGSRVAVPALLTPSHGPADELADYTTVRAAIGRLRRLKSGESDPADPLHRARLHSDLVLRRLEAVPEGGGRTDLPTELQLKCHQGHGGHYDIYGRMWWDRPAPTLTSGCTNPSRGRFAHPDQCRGITVREAMLLQSFPTSATLVGGIEAMSLQVGNAVPPLLAERIGTVVKESEARLATVTPVPMRRRRTA
jgi:DNA (cytosine-5)-methyltransferase 1